MRIAILGAGAWGSALAITLARGHAIRLWSRNAATCALLREQRRHPTALRGICLPASVRVEPRLQLAIEDAELVILAVAVVGARAVLEELARLGCGAPLILACKGFEQDSGLLPHALARSLLAPGVAILSLSGPSFASEVAAGQPTALVLAAEADTTGVASALLTRLVLELHHPHLRLYSNHDPTGVEVAGALKNVIAIAAGMCDGMGLGLNARAALITRGLAEIRRLGERLGASAETFIGLAGVGDLLLTCTAMMSRNYRVGLGLAEAKSLGEILAALGEVAEGVSTARAVGPIAHAAAVEMPICAAVLDVLEGRRSPAQALEHLLGRDPRAET
jgi:glycerol-3-phosphate dehydrogenase (NAD(P)+)